MCICFLWASMCLENYAQDTPKGITQSEHKKQEQSIFCIPINPENKDNIFHFKVKIPDYFCILDPIQLENFAAGSIVDFIIKEDEQADLWSQRMSIHPFRENSMCAEKAIENLKNSIVSSSPKYFVFQDSSEDGEFFQIAKLVISYFNSERNRKEVLFAQYFSGSSDCIGFQYTIAVTPEMPKNQALETIRDFVIDNNNFNITK